MEDEIEFVQALRMPGHEEKKREASPPAHVKTLQTIQETKKSLPIYPFRNDLIQAIRDHQVSEESTLECRSTNAIYRVPETSHLNVRF